MRTLVLLVATTIAWAAIDRTDGWRVALLIAVLLASALLACLRRPLARRISQLLPLLFGLAILAEYAAWPAPPDSRRALLVVAAIGAAGCAACSEALLPSPRWRRRIAGLCLSVVVLALVLNGAEWQHDRTRPRQPYKVVPDDRLGPQNLVRRDPVLGMTLRPGFRGRFVHPQYGAQHVTVNREGFRGPDWQGETDPEAVNVLLFGDSALFGFGAEDDETIAVRLEAALNSAAPGRRFRVYNLGVQSYGPRQAEVLLARFGERLRPAACLAMFHDTNDLVDCRLQFVQSRDAGVHGERLPSESAPGGAPSAPSEVFVLPGGSEVPALWTRIYWVRHSTLARDLDHLAARVLVRWGWTPLTFSYNHEFLRAMRREPDPLVLEEFELAEAAYARMEAHCRDRGSVFGIFRVPGILQCEPTTFRRLIEELDLDVAEFDRTQPGGRVLAWAEARGIPALDLLARLQVGERKSSPDFYREGHPNPRGNERIAGLMLEWMRKDARLSAALSLAASGEGADGLGGR
jgi:hypothetical protein